MCVYLRKFVGLVQIYACAAKYFQNLRVFLNLIHTWSYQTCKYSRFECFFLLAASSLVTCSFAPKFMRVNLFCLEPYVRYSSLKNIQHSSTCKSGSMIYRADTGENSITTIGKCQQKSIEIFKRGILEQ